MSGVRRLTNLTSNTVLSSWLFSCWCRCIQMSSGASHPRAECIESNPPPIWGSAGQKLISMLIVLTNVLWSVCHFWVDLNCPLELNCAVNYHIIAFSAVIYVHTGAAVLQLVGRGISAAGLTPNTAGCFSTSKHQSLSPGSPPLFLLFSLSSFICSFSIFLSYFLSFIHSVLSFSFKFPYRRCFHLLPLYIPSSIICLSRIWRNDSTVPSGLFSCSASFTLHTHTRLNTHTSSLPCHFCIPVPGIDRFSLHLVVCMLQSVILPTVIHCIESLNMCASIYNLCTKNLMR